MPVTLLLVQGVGGSVFALLFLFVPSVNTSYWMLSAVTAQIVIVMYALMFGAVIRLRHTRPNTHRPYRIPGGLPGVWVVFAYLRRGRTAEDAVSPEPAAAP